MTTQPPACGKISEIRERDAAVGRIVMPGTPKARSFHPDVVIDRRVLLRYIDELLSHRHPAPVADERAEVLETHPARGLISDERLTVLDEMADGCLVKGPLLRELIRGYRLSAQPSGALEREKCARCGGSGANPMGASQCPTCPACAGEGVAPSATADATSSVAIATLRAALRRARECAEANGDIFSVREINAALAKAKP